MTAEAYAAAKADLPRAAANRVAKTTAYSYRSARIGLERPTRRA